MLGIWSRGWPICLQESTKLWQGSREINFMSNLYHSCQKPLELSNHPCNRDDTLDSCSRVKGLKDMLTSGNNRTWIVLYHFRSNYQPANKITRSSPESKQLTDRERERWHLYSKLKLVCRKTWYACNLAFFNGLLLANCHWSERAEWSGYPLDCYDY